MTPSQEEHARAFWKWFSEVANELGASFENEHLIDELDRRVTSFAQVGWELGPGLDRPNALVISPSGDEKLLPLTEAFVNLAPEIKDWEFHYAKPPKEWDLRFVVQDREGRPFEIDAKPWEYILLRMPNGKFQVVLRATNLVGIDEALQEAAAGVAVEGIIGEIAKLRRIAGIEFVTEWTDIDRKKATEIRHLGSHLKALAGP